jgi:hypothetical protein
LSVKEADKLGMGGDGKYIPLLSVKKQRGSQECEGKYIPLLSVKKQRGSQEW